MRLNLGLFKKFWGWSQKSLSYEINRPNVKMVGTLFIKYAKLNKFRQAFIIITINNNSKKTLYVLSFHHCKMYVFCPYILSITSHNKMSVPSPPPPYITYSLLHFFFIRNVCSGWGSRFLKLSTFEPII